MTTASRQPPVSTLHSLRQPPRNINSQGLTRRARQAAGVLALAVSLGTPAAALGAAGDLDLTFGSGGRVVTDFAGNQDQVSALVLQPDGKLVAAGRTSTGPLV